MIQKRTGRLVAVVRAKKRPKCNDSFSCPANRRTYDALRETWRKQYDLNEPAVPELVENLLERDWMQQRCTYNICRLEIQLAEAEAAADENRIEKLEKRLVNAYRLKTAAETSFQRALRALEQFCVIRKREELNQRRHSLRKEKAFYDIVYRYSKAGLTPPMKEDTENDERTDSGPRRILQEPKTRYKQ